MGGGPGFSAAVPGAHLKDSELLLLWSVFTKASHAIGVCHNKLEEAGGGYFEVCG